MRERNRTERKGKNVLLTALDQQEGRYESVSLIHYLLLAVDDQVFKAPKLSNVTKSCTIVQK